MRELSLFSGSGGGLLGSMIFGWRTVGYVERDEYCQRVLRARIDDEWLDDAPIFSDIRSFLDQGYARAYQGLVDIVTAGFPCQPFSSAGKRLAGDDDRNLWPETRDTIRDVGPQWVFLENVPGLLSADDVPGRGGYFGEVLRDLASLVYDAEWTVLEAGTVGAPIERSRVFVLAGANGVDGETWMGDLEDWSGALLADGYQTCYELWLQTPSNPSGVVDGHAARLDRRDYADRVRAVGNAQSPQAMAAAFVELATRWCARSMI